MIRILLIGIKGLTNLFFGSSGDPEDYNRGVLLLGLVFLAVFIDEHVGRWAALVPCAGFLYVLLKDDEREPR